MPHTSYLIPRPTAYQHPLQFPTYLTPPKLQTTGQPKHCSIAAAVHTQEERKKSSTSNTPSTDERSPLLFAAASLFLPATSV
mmetsp:Transcript_35204/g.91366  ORF Transcript_35204/g.91366 Transcript_35204/m.91366 type:complete len:82 (-) Transcript_35204:166-411(-)